jgi:hypothetical protein
VTKEVDLRFLAKQLDHVQDDVCSLTSDMARVRDASSRVGSGVSSVLTDVARVEMALENFRESVVRRFDRMDDTMKLGFEMLCDKMDAQSRLLNAVSDQINTVSVDVNSTKRS